jgi:hypothetical protein
MKDKLVRNFVVGTFVSLYLLVSIISTIHVIDFFKLSNPYWLAVTLAIAFEVGAAASLASLVILKKMNKTLVWALFITITLMQMQGNMYYAFINLNDFQSWSELFNLIEEDPLYQKRILAFVSGAILPLIALGFIKSLVDYIKPDEDSQEELTDGLMDDDLLDDFETKPSKEYFEDIEEPVQLTKEQRAEILAEMMKQDQELGLYDEIWDQTLMDGLEDEDFKDVAPDEIQEIIDGTSEEEKPWWDGPVAEIENQKTEETVSTEEPIGHDMLDILEQEIESDDVINKTSVGSIVKERGLIDDEKLWNEAMAKKAKEDMDLFIKNKNENKQA